jgi:predicted  nucleic acid-binding Zn-ribbon protein
MNGDLELLLKLQNIDYDLGELERSKEYIPDMMENLKREIDDSEGKHKMTTEALETARLEQKDVDLQLQEGQAKLKKLQQRMMDIKTNKEYDALVSEIDQIKENISELETRAVELLEAIEQYEKELEGLNGQVSNIKKINSQQLSSLQEQIDSVGTKIQSKEKERQELVSQVSKRVIMTYDRIRKGKGGAAVVAVKKRACGACYKALPPQKIQEIKLAERIITCDSCGRMLIWTPDSNN